MPDTTNATGQRDRRRSRFSGRVLATAAVIVAGAATFAPVANAAPVYPSPLADSFFMAPDNLADAKPGDILKTRTVPAPFGFVATDAVQLQFRSENSEGKPIAAITTILSPQNAPAGRPLLSYQHIINALGLACAPSTAMYTNDPKLAIREMPGLNVAIQRGWSVAIPDHLGPSSAYGAAKLGGKITLDGIRAATHAPGLGLADSPIGIAGYSGGGMASAWAAALAASYAPELKVVGSAYGGVPMDIGKMADALGVNAHPAFGLAMAAALGLEREYPDRIPVSDQLNATGRGLRDSLANACTNDLMVNGAGRSASQLSTSTSLIDSPATRTVMAENSLDKFDGVPNAPVYEWHSPTDVLIPVDAIDTTIARYCAAGVKVRTAKVPSPDHLSAAVLGLPDALDFLDARFAGRDTPTNC